jgi:tetratricopeptide (TPR) repeat protein
MVYLREILTELLQPYDSTTLVFDGIDQSTMPDDLVACISNVTNSMAASKLFNIVVTSQLPLRSMQRIKDNLGLFTLDLNSTAVRQSIEVYVKHALNAFEPSLDVALKVIIELKGLKKADEGWPYVMYSLATKYANIGRASEAEGVIREVLSLRAARQRQDSDPIISSKRILAWVLRDQGRRQEAEDLQRSILETCRRTKGEKDDMTKNLINDLSLTLSHGDASTEQQQEAILLLEQISDAWKTPEGNETEKSLSIANNLAAAYMQQQNRLEDAEAMMQRVIAADRSLHGEDSDGGVVYKSNLGELYSRQKKWVEAENLQLEALEIRKRTLGMDNLMTV